MAEKTVLVITPHPDDHVFSAGTLMLLKEAGYTIHEVVATKGEAGTWLDENESTKKDFEKSELVRTREAEIAQASAQIGISSTTALGLPDGGVEYSLQTVEALLTKIRELRPTVVVAMHPGDYHRDHRNIAEMTLEALRRAQWSYKPEAGAPWKAPVVLMAEGFYFVQPHLVVDITRFKAQKDAVLKTYASQFNTRERDLIAAMNYFRAFNTRNTAVTAAEAFEVHPEFPLSGNDIGTLLAPSKN